MQHVRRKVIINRESNRRPGCISISNALFKIEDRLSFTHGQPRIFDIHKHRLRPFIKDVEFQHFENNE